tara:strand:- start:2832 stop:3125 length:294 start_codon:yes stop_codon:yes gene_type:complete
MDLIKLEILCKVEDENGKSSAYNDLLQELNIEAQVEEEYHWQDMWFNSAILAQEVFCFTARKKNPEHSVVEFYDARNLIVNLPVEKLIEAIHAAATI